MFPLDMKRLFDVLMGGVLITVFAFPMLFIAVVVRATSSGPALYWSYRIGKGGGAFKMPKFRTMLLDTPAIATHLMLNPKSFFSPIGGFLRSTV